MPAMITSSAFRSTGEVGNALARRKEAPHRFSQPESAVLVVDDDPSLRQALARLFRSVGLTVEVFGSTRELLQHTLPDSAACLVLDVRLPGVSGLDFQLELAKSGVQI